MKQRIITAVVALIIFIPILILGGWWIELAGCALAVIALSEVFIMRKKIIVSFDFLISALGVLAVAVPDSMLKWLPAYISRLDIIYLFVVLLLLNTVASKNKTSYDDVAVSALSIFYIGTGFHYFIMLRNDPNGGLDTLLFAMLIVWLTDSGAYFCGRAFGKHKLWPAISPNKTWEGSIGGNVTALIFAAIYLNFFPQAYSFWPMMGIALALSIIGSLGDLIESALKRYYGVKDSGKILPGHGGILDRFDSMLLVMPMIHFFGIL
ncbi:MULTISPECIES: phosphatidate cytidylyltransferase [unclassified Lacticaseibacillus]|uniref:phosphatidate cytidylyltransferase n=1 Tax=unclassified Lacticaseibacillus TaxID=2759744 RepID=UPI001944F783|nr:MULTISPECIES: phosphatidate cytidylyltransferase [unclassified Lacticaseibacillus]